jgi:hypothetical protein
MGFFITKKEVQSIIDLSIEKLKSGLVSPSLKNYLLKKDFELFKVEVEDKISKSSINSIKEGTYFVEGEVINIEIDGQLIKISPKVIEQPPVEYDCEGASQDYYERYPFVKIYQDIHGGTAWENYVEAGKKDGRTWDMSKCGISIPTTTTTSTTTTSTSTTSTTTDSPIILDGELRIVDVEQLGISNDSSYQLDIPKSVYAPNNEIWDNLKIDVIDDKFLRITLDGRGWTMTTDPLYKVEISEKWLTKDELEKIDFSSQSGNDILIYCGLPSRGKMIVGWTFVHIKGNSSTKLPQFIVREPSKRMPQFWRNFPDVALNPSKRNIIQFQQLDEQANKVSENYFKKGFAVAKSDDITKTFFADYDYWCYENGGKRWDNYKSIVGTDTEHFATAHEYNINWIRTTPFATLYQIFKNNIINPSKGYPFILLDWEAFNTIPNDKVVIDKVGTLFYECYKDNGVKISTYIDSNPFKCNYNTSISKQDMDSYNSKYSKPLSNIASGFFKYDFERLDVNSGKGLGIVENMGKYICAISGDYMHFINHSNLYGIFQELELCAEHNIDSLTLNWGINEGVDSSDYYTHQKAFRKNNGFLFQAETKPPTPASYLKNSTDISNLFGKGFYAWDEPLPFEEGCEHHGGHAKKSDNSEYLSNDFNPKNYGTFHYNAQIGYDYVARSLNKLSKFNDYLNDVKGFKKVPYYIGNSRFDGDKLLPASAEFYKLPIVRVKKHSQNNEWLLFILNHHLNHYDKQIVKVEIDGKYLEVELNGQFARVEKVVL